MCVVRNPRVTEDITDGARRKREEADSRYCVEIGKGVTLAFRIQAEEGGERHLTGGTGPANGEVESGKSQLLILRLA